MSYTVFITYMLKMICHFNTSKTMMDTSESSCHPMLTPTEQLLITFLYNDKITDAQPGETDPSPEIIDALTRFLIRVKSRGVPESRCISSDWTGHVYISWDHLFCFFQSPGLIKLLDDNGKSVGEYPITTPDEVEKAVGAVRASFLHE